MESDVETENYDVTVLKNIVFTFDVHFSGLLDCSLTAVVNIVIIFYNLGADEASLKVGMNDSGALGCLAALAECPCTHLLGPGGEEGLQIEQSVCRRQPRQPASDDAYIH